MYCPKCGTQNPDDAQSCNTCGAILTSSPTTAAPVTPKTSGLAITALILGILAFFTCALTAIPAIILGIIALVKIEKSGGRITGKGLAVAGIVAPVFSFVLLILLLLPALFRVRQLAFREVCAANLSGIGKAMAIYANDFDDEFPRAGGRTTVWSDEIADYRAPNQFLAYGMAPDNTGGEATITSSFYLLVKYYEVTPRSFVCKADTGVTEYDPSDEPGGYIDYTDFWDFGPNPREHCSYSYHMPYSPYALTTSSDPDLAVAADRNPWIKGPGYDPAYKTPTDFAAYNPDGSREQVSLGNSPSHQGDSQNVLFVDIHVEQAKSPACGVNDDNIYTYWGNTNDIRRGTLPTPQTMPTNREDSYLVNDMEGRPIMPKGRACFLANTPVWINGAMAKISDVKAGQIINAIAATTIEKIEMHEGVFECRDIMLQSGNCISVVESHLFMLESGAWVTAKQLRSGMNLKTLNGSIAIKSVTTRAMPYVGTVYNVKVNSSDRYMVGKDAVIVRDY